MTNLITAIINIVQNPIIKLGEYAKSHNRANNMGDGLEEYVKDIFAGTIGEKNSASRTETINKCFSYLGNTNNPPDAIIRGGDAVEVKKLESHGAGLALNSSYPKAKLFYDSPMITAKCRCCEEWQEKDIIYAIGVVNKNQLSQLSFVYGMDYAASAEIYERIRNKIREGVLEIPDIEFAETKELGRVNRVDPLGITYLRIRGMWHIENPANVFDYVHRADPDKNFNLMAIINTNKYNTFQNRGDLEKLAKTDPRLQITDVRIKTPDNPAILKDAKLITFAV